MYVNPVWTDCHLNTKKGRDKKMREKEREELNREGDRELRYADVISFICIYIALLTYSRDVFRKRTCICATAASLMQ
jgi:hypothetical protein